MEPDPGSIVGLPSLPPILCPNLPFSLVQLSSHLTLRLYAKRSAHPDMLIGTHEMPIPLASQSGSFCFVDNSLPFSHLNISRADIACVLGNGVRGAARPTQPVTLYITFNITPPNLYNSPPNIPTEGDGSSPRHLVPMSYHQPVETGNIMPREEISPSSTRNPRIALHRADKAMERVVPIDRSNSWERAVRKVKWVMDTLGPIAEVRVVSF